MEKCTLSPNLPWAFPQKTLFNLQQFREIMSHSYFCFLFFKVKHIYKRYSTPVVACSRLEKVQSLHCPGSNMLNNVLIYVLQ